MKTDKTLFAQFGRSQLDLYDRILKTVKDEITVRLEEVGFEKSRMTILAALTRLRQVCCDPRLLGQLDGSALPPSAKLEVFKDLMSGFVSSGRKALVFSQTVEMQQLLGDAVAELNIPYLSLRGGAKNGEELAQRFQDKGGPPVFLMTLAAAARHLKVTEADTIVHYDPWRHRVIEDSAHPYCLDQDKPVQVYRLVCKDSIEQKMVELSARERETAALGSDLSADKGLTREDLETLLISARGSP